LPATCALAGEDDPYFTGSIAGFIPGTFHAVYNGTKAFIDSLSFALRTELKDTGVTVTCLMPGATGTEFFERADMTDTKVGQAKKTILPMSHRSDSKL
jgi:short-subunit dehydrogenase